VCILVGGCVGTRAEWKLTFFVAGSQTYLINRHELKEIIRFDYVHGDIKWDQRKAIVYPCFFMLAGLFAGMFGSK
jgi:hypothetical protein